MSSEYDSVCNSNKHQEFDCLTKYGVSGKKFVGIMWCEPCREKYNSYFEEGRIINGERKQRRKRKTSKES